MKKIISRKLGIMTALLLQIAVVIPAMPSYAAMTDDPSYTMETYSTGTYYVPTNGSTHRDWNVTMSMVDPGVCLTTLDSYYVDQDGNILIKADDFSKLSNLQTETDQWIANNEEKIIPNGTASAQIPYVVSDWEAACMTYDYKAAADQTAARFYQNAYSGLTTGKGICATYALIFNSIVTTAPINPKTGLVDYACENPTHLPTRYVYNTQHAWSAVLMNDEWRWFDVTNYDATKDKRFLNFKPGQNLDTGLYSTYFQFN